MPETTEPQLSEAEVAEIEARANAARDGVLMLPRITTGPFPERAESLPVPLGKAESAFIRSAKMDVSALIRDWRALTEENERLKNVTIPDSISDLVLRIDAAIRFSVPIQQQTKLRSFINELIFLNAALREQLARAESEIARTKQHRDDLIEELEREQKIGNKTPARRLGIK